MCIFAVQVLIRNSLAVLSGSEAPRVMCENLNISVCPLTESSHKVPYTQIPLNKRSKHATKSHCSICPVLFLSVFHERVQSSSEGCQLACAFACQWFPV